MIGVLVLGAVTALMSLLLRKQQKEIATLLGVAASVFLFLDVLRDISAALTDFHKIISGEGIEEEVAVLVKALGVAAIVQITADICKEAGETTVAGQVEMVGKAEILLLSLPLLSKLLSMIQRLLE